MIAKWLPVDLYMGGAEHTVLHLLYARFFAKVLQTLGYINFNEPFLKLRHQGTILAEDGRKMSKSLGNVINPDDVVSVYGADSLRVYEMFMGPIEQSKPWSTTNIIGSRRFLERVWGLHDRIADVAIASELEVVLNQTIKKVTDDIELLKFNTAISSIMILLNAIPALGDVPRILYETLLKLVSPIAPHITEELWSLIGHTTSIHTEKWPTYDETKTTSKTVTIAIQINGKLRGSMECTSDSTKEDVEAEARVVVQDKLEGKTVERVIVVPNRLINFVVNETQ
jgi:leucyl-tRNA synthetase